MGFHTFLGIIWESGNRTVGVNPTCQKIYETWHKKKLFLSIKIMATCAYCDPPAHLCRWVAVCIGCHDNTHTSQHWKKKQSIPRPECLCTCEVWICPQTGFAVNQQIMAGKAKWMAIKHFMNLWNLRHLLIRFLCLQNISDQLYIPTKIKHMFLNLVTTLYVIKIKSPQISQVAILST